MINVCLLCDKIVNIGFWLALLSAPTQYSITPVKGLHVSFSDVVLCIIFGLWLFSRLLRKDWGTIFTSLPWPHLFLMILAAFSFFVAKERMEAGREIIQIGLYLIAAPLLALDQLKEIQKRKYVLLALIFPCAINVIIASVQYFNLSEADPLTVKGLFGNCNVFGGYLALMLPLLYVLALKSQSKVVRFLSIFTLLGSMIVNLSGAAFIISAIGILLVSLSFSRKLTFATLAVFLAVQVLVLPHLPRENDIAHFRSVALYDEDGQPERRYPEWQAAVSMVLEYPWLGVGAGNYQRNIGPFYDTVPNATGPSEPDIQNLYLVVAGSLGLPAVLTLIMLFANAIFTSLKGSKENIIGVGVAGGIAAFAFTAIWHPLLVRGIGLPLATMLALAYSLLTVDCAKNKCQIIENKI